jgi:dTDP-4-dehydrorhamnose reductase
VTLRTSIIGHELKTEFSLVDWFMSQHESVKGYSRAIYTGFPTTEIVNIITNYVIPNEDLNGLYHVSSESISKYELLKKISKEYQKDIQIEPFEDFEIDRSLNSDRFKEATGYCPPSWNDLIKSMYQHVATDPCYVNKSFRNK